MKTKISIPDPIFKSAEAVASQLGMSRSEFYFDAVEAFVFLHKHQCVIANLSEVYTSESNSLVDEYYQLQQKTFATKT